MKIYAHSNTTEFAQLVVENLNDQMFTKGAAGGAPNQLLKINRERFADGEINITFNESIRGQQLVIIAQVEMPYENLFELFLILDAARRCSARELIVVIPYLPHARQERRDEKRSPISSRLIADMLQTAGADRVISMDIHTSAIEGNYTIAFDKLSPFYTFIDIIQDMKLENMMLVSPDFGFMKKMEKFQDVLNCDMAVIDKHREKANEIKKMRLIGEVKGKNVIIIDDIIDTGGTLVKASEMVLDKGALSVTVFATHAVLSGDASNNLANSRINKIYLTNTIRKRHLLPKFQIVDVSDVFAEAILKIENE